MSLEQSYAQPWLWHVRSAHGHCVLACTWKCASTDAARKNEGAGDACTVVQGMRLRCERKRAETRTRLRLTS